VSHITLHLFLYQIRIISNKCVGKCVLVLNLGILLEIHHTANLLSFLPLRLTVTRHILFLLVTVIHNVVLIFSFLGCKCPLLHDVILTFDKPIFKILLNRIRASLNNGSSYLLQRIAINLNVTQLFV
jgi:hypothetical protein